MDAAPRGVVRPGTVRDLARIRGALGTLLRALQFHDRERASRYGLSPSQCHALQLLLQLGPLTVTELGDGLYLEKSTASRLAKSLLDAGLLRRRAPPGDGRVIILQLTERGHRQGRRILNDLEEEYRRFLEGVDPETRQVLPDALAQFTRAVAETLLLTDLTTDTPD